MADLKIVYEKVAKDYWEQEAKNYFSYLSWIAKDPKATWFQNKDAMYFITKYIEVKSEWLTIDWKHITLQSTWVSFDYIAYKNKMLLAYPDSKIDINLVYEWDIFNFKKENWKVTYTHDIANPFGQTEDKIKWGYCIIKNKRWEFITLLSKSDFEKHRKVAKTDFIWKSWYAEMCMKTLFKKAIKVHFDDIYEIIENEDNKQYDLEKSKPSPDEKAEELNLKYKDL